MKGQDDRYRTYAMEYKTRDLVRLDATTIPSHYPRKKLDHQNIAPHIVDSNIVDSEVRRSFISHTHQTPPDIMLYSMKEYCNHSSPD